MDEQKQAMTQISVWMPLEVATALRVMAAQNNRAIGQTMAEIVKAAARHEGVLIHAIPPTPAPMPEAQAPS